MPDRLTERGFRVALGDYGCDLGQGYGICRTLDRQALDDWIAAQVPVG